MLHEFRGCDRDSQSPTKPPRATARRQIISRCASCKKPWNRASKTAAPQRAAKAKTNGNDKHWQQLSRSAASPKTRFPSSFLLPFAFAKIKKLEKRILKP